MRMFKPMTKDEYIKFRAMLIRIKEEAIERKDRNQAILFNTFIDNLDFFQEVK